ncbi:hypothetical protein OkiPb00459_41490 [Escherichia coli]|nr:hypothetical protein CL8NIID26_52650 [Escherichia coli]
MPQVMLTYSKKDSYIIPVTASFIGLSVKLRLPHTSHLTPHTSHLTPHTSQQRVWTESGS